MTAFADDMGALLDGAGPPPALTGLPSGAAARALAKLAAKRPLLAVTATAAEAERLAAGLRFYLGECHVLPVDDTPPYEGLSPHPAIPRARIAALARLRRAGETGGGCAVVAPVAALLQRVLPPAALGGLTLRPGDIVEPAALASTLADLGYLSVGRVEDPGSVALRGEVLDAWPTGAEAPARVEFFDDEVEQLRALSPRTQRSAAPLDSLTLLPNREEPLDERALSRAARWLSERVGELGYGARRRRRILEDLRAGIRFGGCELYLPALSPVVPPLDYAAGARIVVVADSERAVRAALDKHHDRIAGRWKALDPALRPLSPPEHRWLSPERALAGLARAARVLPAAIEGPGGAVDLGCRDNGALTARGGDLAGAAGILGGWLAGGWRVGLVVESTSRADRIRQLLAPHGLRPVRVEARSPERWAPGALSLVLGDLPAGFHAPDEQLAVISADEIFGAKIHVRDPGRVSSAARLGQITRDASVSSFAQLKEGDLLVHQLHGVGRYLGLRKIKLGAGGGPRDMLLMEYRGGDKLYLPVHKLDQISPYRAGGSAGAGRARLDRLGGETWAARVQKVKGSVLQLAHELIRLEANRRISPGHAYVGTSLRFRRFEEAFPYTETPDQLGAIEAVLADLAKPEPMDRLIVGDVGFGKTEVAMRAAMRVAEEGRQVGVLCPTTVLAYQHARTFRERFTGAGVSVGLLSSFNSPQEQRRVKQGIRDGSVQIAIGTTSLFARGLRFADLGLVIVDEEHRFGVKQKQRLKRLRADVDYLAMSATPIPRTLHMALTGIREFSIIATPPADRLPVRTSLAEFSPERIREDVLRELSRGGQVFIVHNRVASIQVLAEAVRGLVPEARVAVAHGQQEPQALERALVDFVEGRSSVLVCTAIIESGVDMPAVNTILVNRADRFGLAQLYQLRGRVGRSHRRGYCTLLVDAGQDLTEDAMRRMRVLQEHTELGSGFAIASADLDIRGAGDLLGRSQHGHIQSVGFETWVSLLEGAIAEARGHSERERLDPEVELGRPAFLPESYIPDVEDRLLFYRRLAMARDVAGVRAVMDELEDSLGEPPAEALGLGRLLEVRCRCRALGVARLSWLKIRVVLELSEHSPITAERIDALLATYPQRVARERSGALSFHFTPQEGERPFLFVHWLLGLLER